MGMSDDQVKDLLEWFANESETKRNWAEKRRNASEENNKWIQPDTIKEMSDEELEKRFLEYYKSGTGEKQSLNQIYRDRIIRDKKRFREVLLYLLDERIDIKERINQIFDGEHKIKGFGRAIATAFLMDFDQSKYCLWNDKTDSGFKVLGWKVYERKDSKGTAYEKVLEAHQELKDLRPDLNLTYLETDLFLHTIFAEEEAQKILKEMPGGTKPGGDTDEHNYWQIAPGEKARLWDDLLENSIAAVGYRELDLDLSGKSEPELLDLCKQRFSEVELSDMQTKIQFRQLWNFVNLKPGDRFVTNKGRRLLLALGVVKSGYKFRPERKEYQHTVDVDYYKVSESGIPIPKDFQGKFGRTIVPLTKSEFETLEKIFPTGGTIKPPYTLQNFIQETGISEGQIQQWLRILRRKKHIIFQGPPGTGKTFVAQRLARLLVSDSAGLVETVQFHPAYAYEDFVQGIRPEVTDGKLSYALMPGRFKEFCDRSMKKASDARCVMVIDEINRANLARVFGELMYLLEYRDQQIPLSAGGEPFKIPENLYLIGTMNTADRSIALVDHALRRRFSFIRLKPDYEVLRAHLEPKGYSADGLISVLKEINKAIDDPNYKIGISFFMREDNKLKKHLPDIWVGEIEPYLKEFFYDQPGKVNPFRWATLVEGKLNEWA